ncbi:BslA/BslB family hydrophobin [Lysinibacillus sp. NPDC093712]|uniref:BslA/BslB family hydrophobin n=1 Tax=Lysinibacillus sp. NPDC093712 TaxID=3390579 RepID=UPI003D053140
MTVTKDVANTLRLDYYSYTTFSNGTLVITLPSEIVATTNDYVHLGVSWRNITSSEISADGHTLTFTGVNTSGDIAFEFKNKVISAGSYTINAQGDADGVGSKYKSDNRTVTIIAE